MGRQPGLLLDPNVWEYRLRIETPINEPRVAVLLYGPLRSFEDTAASFLRHVAGPNDASLFYFGPAETDQPTVLHKGGMDEAGNLTNLKSGISSRAPVYQPAFLRSYDSYLKGYAFHDIPDSKFIADAASMIARDDWLFGIHPYRMLSMFYNIVGAVKLLQKYEREHGHVFDEVVLTRPDQRQAMNQGSSRRELPDGSVALFDRLFAPSLSAQPNAVQTTKARLLLWRARQQSRRGDLASAEKLYAQLLRIAPHRHRAWIQYGHIVKDRETGLPHWPPIAWH